MLEPSAPGARAVIGAVGGGAVGAAGRPDRDCRPLDRAGGTEGPTNRYIRCGASPRASQALLLGGKVKAVTDGRYHVSYADIKSIAHQSLRHRLILNFEAEADRVDPDDIVTQIMDLTPTEPVAVPAMKA